MFGGTSVLSSILRGSLVLALVLASLASPAQAQIFSPPKNASDTPGESRQLQRLVDGRGNVYVVWVEFDISPRAQQIFFARSSEDGAAFSAPRNISIPGMFSDFPQLGVDGMGNIYVVWISGEAILFTHSTDGGSSFSAPKSISSPSLARVGPRLAVDTNANIYVVWVGVPTIPPLNAEIFFTRSTDGGATFSTPLNVSATRVTSLHPELALDESGNINLVWMDFPLISGVVQLFFTRSADRGTTFSAPTLISGLGPEGKAQLAVDSVGNINVVWSNGAIFFSRSTDAGATFSAAKVISGTRCGGIEPDLAVDRVGNISVVWLGCGIGFAHSTDGGATFSDPKDISESASSSAHDPRLAVDGVGNINVVWSAAPSDIFFSRSTDAGATFSAPKNVSATIGGSGLPQLAVDTTGSLYILWLDNTPGNFDIFFSRSLDLFFQDLITLVFDINLKQGIANSLDAKLQAAIRALEDPNRNNDSAALNALQAFVTEVEHQRGVNITVADADRLIASAREIIAWLGG